MSMTLVTGGGGFIGAKIVGCLRARGDSVRVLDHNGPPADYPGDVDYRVGSILDPGDLKGAFRGVTRVVHTAGVADLWLKDRRQFDAVNHQGTLRVLETAQRAGVSAFVHTSSETVLRGMGRGRKELIDAAGPLPPLNSMPGPYTRSKWQADSAVRTAASRDFHAVIVYPTLPLGPGDRRLTPPTRMLLDFLRKPPPAILDCALNAVSADDVAEGHVRALERGEAGERFILGAENIRLSDLLGWLHEAGGPRPPRGRISYPVGWLAAQIMERGLAPLTRKAPQASIEGVRLARLNLWSNVEPTRERLGLPGADPREAVKAAVRWLRESGLA